MSLKKILCFVFILSSLFIFADGSENSDVQSPPVKETEDQNLPATENKNLSENEKDPEESDKGFYSIQSSGLTAKGGFLKNWMIRADLLFPFYMKKINL